MTVEIIECDQGGREWHQARAGCITASMAGTIMDKLTRGPNKGGYKAAALDYAFRLAIERISGEPLDEGFETWAMARGHELEPEARAAHAFQHDLEIERAGFVRTTDGKFGASADGLIGDDGGSEYKCLIAPGKLRTVILDRDLSEYLPQIQCCMWLTGRKWWHYGLYCPALRAAGKELTVIPVERDEECIEAMEAQLVKFDGLVEQNRARIQEQQ